MRSMTGILCCGPRSRPQHFAVARDRTCRSTGRTWPRRSKAWANPTAELCRCKFGESFIDLLKIEASPAAEPRAGWRSTIRTARAEIEDILHDSPSLLRQLDATIIEQIGIAARLAEDDLAHHGETVE